ncbi:cell division protein FtsQ/DivIB [Olsenella intestinalis]|uniref:cell division protein FtsQ/DivIB n=1 Tax=Olsenella intestinalis TaxID=2930083 RepID=UPI0020107785|nr:FtsQ-type POTRA domain-containing protein [Olsenella intestinalis]
MAQDSRNQRRATPRGSAPRARSQAPRTSRAGGAGRSRGARQRPAARAAAPARKPVPDQRVSAGERGAKRSHVRHVIVGGIVVAAIALVALLGYLLLSYTPAFSIQTVVADSTEHITSANIAKLANVPAGSTLLNLDEAAVTNNLRKNPWVGEVSYVREFPSTLKIEVHERAVDSLVLMSTGNMAWCLGSGNVWIEPVPLSVGQGKSINEVALAKAREMGVMLITGTPPTVSPVAGSKATDDVLDAISTYRSLFSKELSDKIVSFSASSLDSISCVLENGVEISLGPATSVDSKESVIKEILSKYAGKLTYINVRVPSKPSYRMVSSDSVGQGSGTSGQDYADASQKVDGATTGATTGATGTGATTDATTATGVTDATTTAAGEASAAQSEAQSGDAGQGQGQAASTAGE